MRGKLTKLQQEYSLKIKEYLESKSELSEYYISVNFNIDYEFNEYFTINFGRDLNIILECKKIPYLRLLNNIFYHYWDLEKISDVLKALSVDDEIYVTLIKFAEGYYRESQKILDE